MAIKYERSRHYTGRHITQFEVRCLGFNLFDYWHADDGMCDQTYDHTVVGNWRGGRRAGMIRLGFFTTLHVGLFYGRNNYLKGYGWEAWVSPMRYCPRWLCRFVDWSFGRSSKDSTIGYWTGNTHIQIHRWRGWAWCSHHHTTPPKTWDEAPVEPDDYQDYGYAESETTPPR
jgi:hypothetical protein